jgi:hypothetical protein
LNGNAVASDARQANRQALSRVQQNDCVVGTQRNDFRFLDWSKRAQGDSPIGQAFLFMFIEVLLAWLVKLNDRDPPQVVHGLNRMFRSRRIPIAGQSPLVRLLDQAERSSLRW